MEARPTLAAVAAILTVGAAPAIAGCGSGGQQDPRSAVASYVRQAGQIEAQLATPLTAVTQAGAEFAQAQGGGRITLLGNLSAAAEESSLLRASTRIQTLRGRLAALPAPVAAARLKAMLLELTDLEGRATRDVAALVTFVPRFAAELKPLGPATQRLERSLAATSGSGTAPAAAVPVAVAYSSRAAALRRFKSTVDAISAKLKQLHPPAVSRPGYRAQLAALAGMSASAGKLATALTDGAQGQIQGLLTDFDHAALSTRSLAVQRAQIASIRAYDAQSQRLSTLSSQIDRERLRLSDTLN